MATTIISTDKPVFADCAVGTPPVALATSTAAIPQAAVAPLDYQLEPKPVSRRRYRRVLWLCGAGWMALALIVMSYGWWRVRMAARATVAPAATVRVATPTVRPAPPVVTTYTAIPVDDRQQRQDRIKSLMAGTPRAASTVVYEEDPAAAGKLLALPSEYRAASPAQSNMSTPQGYQPPAYLPAPDLDMTGRTKVTDYPPAELFRAQLTSPVGNRRLVRIVLRMRFGSPARPDYPGEPKPQQVISLARQLGFEIYRVEDSDALLRSVRSGDSLKIVQTKGEQIPIRWVDGVLRADRPAEHNVRVYAGQLDPNDPSHFTIDYELNGARNVIDGWLTDDDFLRIRPRGGKVTGGDWRIADKP